MSSRLPGKKGAYPLIIVKKMQFAETFMQKIHVKCMSY
jgi:hypothetical protein